jgi:hypothetical protein
MPVPPLPGGSGAGGAGILQPQHLSQHLYAQTSPSKRAKLG